MNSHCLFCGKRLSFFHDKKKPYCSDVHEDRYREQQSKTGLSRLQDDVLTPASQEIQTAAGLPPPKVPELFSYEDVDPAILQEIHGPEEISSRGGPPAVTYLIADPNVVHAIPPAFSLRDPGNAAFPEEDWGGATALDTSSALLSLGAAQIGIGPVTFPRAEPVFVEAVVVEAVVASTVVAQKLIAEKVQIKAEPPEQVTCLAYMETRPLPIAETIPVRVFCEASPVIAPPGLALPARHSMLAPVAAGIPTFSSLEEHAQTEVRREFVSDPLGGALRALCAQTGLLESLPAPQPLRFRRLLDLHNQIFQPKRRSIAHARQISLDWNALPLESLGWESKPLRRRVIPVIPKLSGG